MSTFKLIYRPEEPNHWHRVEMPDINDYGYFESDPEIPGSGWEKKEYDEAVKKAIDEAKPIAPQDQKKVERFVWESIVVDIKVELPLRFQDWKPSSDKLYDSGDLEFELQLLNPKYNYQTDRFGGEQFWVLKSKVEEKVKYIDKNSTPEEMSSYVMNKLKPIMEQPKVKEEPMNISTSEKGNSSHCVVCGRFLVTVRGRHPNDPERKTCPQCTLEKLEQIGDLFIQATVKQPNQ